MEQDLRLYEFKMNGESFSFEARSKDEAENYRDVALTHFKDTLGESFTETQISGPFAKASEATN